MTATNIDDFVDALARVPNTEVVANPYRHEACRSNLRNYLRHVQSVGFDVMLVGEAPGCRGCAKTGIPFTDACQLANPANEFALGSWERKLPPNVFLADSEETASQVWPVIRESGLVPLMWNSFPFHPHEKANVRKNRAPLPSEQAEGLCFIEELISIFDIDRSRIYAVGRKAQAQLGLDDSRYIRHPSYGGNRLFAEHFATKIVVPAK